MCGLKWNVSILCTSREYICPRCRFRLRAAVDRGRKKPVSNLVLSLVVALGFYLGVSVAAFKEHGYLTLFGMETLLSLTVWLFVYYILEELRRT